MVKKWLMKHYELTEEEAKEEIKEIVKAIESGADIYDISDFFDVPIDILEYI